MEANVKLVEASIDDMNDRAGIFSETEQWERASELATMMTIDDMLELVSRTRQESMSTFALLLAACVVRLTEKGS